MNLQKQKQINNKQTDFITADFSSFYILLICAPESVDSHEVQHIFNYNNVNFDVDEDNILKETTKKEMAFAADGVYPVLMVDSSSPLI